MNFKIMIPLVCLLGFHSCHPRGPIGLVVGLGTTVTGMNASYKVTKVTWTNDFLIFATDLVFDDVHIADLWSSWVEFDNYHSSQPLDDYYLPFNLEKTNLENETQIGEDRCLTITGTYAFYFDQVSNDVSAFRDNEYASITLDLFVVESGYQSTYFEILSTDVTFENE